MNLQLTILIVLFLCFSGKDSSVLKVENVNCTSTVHLSGGEIPFFHWELSSNQRNQKQTAWRILVSDNQEMLTNQEANIWDSGKIESDQQSFVDYSGPELRSGQTYFWKVKVWNQDNKESDWSETAVFRTGLLNESDWHNAQWIGYEEMPADEKVVPGVHGNGDHLGDRCLDRTIVPLFRKEFEVSKPISEAMLYVSGLGHYEASINGEKVGNAFLTPGWTNYDKTVFYNSYEVTPMLKQEKNAIGAIVGNGFYNINRERYRKLVIAWGNPKLIGQLRIRYTDGSEQIVVTGNDWKTAPSPITFSSIYGGEDYDAQLEQTGWNQAGFNDSAWKDVLLVAAPSGKLTEEKDFPLKIEESFSAKAMKQLADGSWLYDFGQNASGIVELKVKGKKGQTVRLVPSELITEEGEPNQWASGYPYSFSYTLKGEGEETWQPRFTYYGFRYVKLEGGTPVSGNAGSDLPQLVDMKLLHNRNSTPQTGSFSCSNELFNRTFNLINWGIKSNLQSVLTDCPHREKLGWLEQTFLMGSAVHFNFNLYQLYCKQVNDMMEAQLENGLVPDIAPEYVPFGDGFRDSPEWGSASVILPWLIYQWYGDKSVMEKAWPMMVRYVEYLKGKSDNHILSHGLGDWFDLGPRQPGEAQLTPKSLTATSIYYYDVKLLAEMAKVMDKQEEAVSFAAWASEIKQAFDAMFFNAETGVISTGSQTAMAMPWCVGLVDDAFKNKVMQNLEDSIRAQGKPLTAGDVGFRYLVEALTKSGRSQLLFEMNARDDVPGYGFQLKKGATALTESWPALENVSNNHLMLGHLMDWFYAGLGGIGQSENSVAYKEIVIKPEMVGDLSWVKSSYHCPYGEIRSEWQRTGTAIRMEVSIPVNTTALIYIPATSKEKIKVGKDDLSARKDIQLMGEEQGRLICKVGSGRYSFSVN